MYKPFQAVSFVILQYLDIVVLYFEVLHTRAQQWYSSTCTRYDEAGYHLPLVLEKIVVAHRCVGDYEVQCILYAAQSIY